MSQITITKLDGETRFSGCKCDELGRPLHDGRLTYGATLTGHVVHMAWEHGCDLEDLADGFGPGAGTHGDWSGVRDSTPAAWQAMVERALNWLDSVLKAKRGLQVAHHEATILADGEAVDACLILLPAVAELLEAGGE